MDSQKAPAPPAFRPAPPVTASLLRPIAGNARMTVGVALSAASGKLSAAIVAASGPGAAATYEAVAQASTPLSPAIVRELARTALDAELPLGPSELMVLGRDLAEIQTAVIKELLTAARLGGPQVLAVAVHGPGVWQLSEGGPQGFLGLCDAPRLSQLTGLNVLDALPARDLAAGGSGGPITALAEARLLQTRHRSSLLVDLGRTLRVTYVPAESLTRGRADKRPRVLSFQVGPGMRLVDALAQKLTGQPHAIDAGGRLAVQGQQLPELIAHWSRDPYFENSVTRWRPAGAPIASFLADSLRLAVESKWSVRDLLCTASHFMAQQVADTVMRRLPAGYPVDELLLTGGGVQNGLLMRQIAARLPNMPVTRLADRVCSPETFEAATVAVMAMLAIDQEPATAPEITGAREACWAGRWTPGTPSAWKRLTAEMTAHAPAGLLRNAS